MRTIKSPLHELSSFGSQCRNIVTFLKNHHALNYELKSAQKERNIRRLVLPARTRWGTLLGCFESVLQSEDIIHTMVHARDFLTAVPSQKETRQAVKNTVADPNFVTNLKKAIFILKPLNDLTLKFQNDAEPVSEVYAEFSNIPKYYDSDNAQQHITISQAVYIKDLIKERFQFIYGDSHGLGYLLDPRYAGFGMENSLREELEDFIMKFHVEEEQAGIRESIFRQITDFRMWAQEQRERNTFRYQMLVKKKKTVLEFWKIDGGDYPDLQKLALRVFSMTTSSASSERNFSTFGFIHSKLRNKLSDQNVKKLVYIKTNSNILSKTAESDQDQDDSDSN